MNVENSDDSPPKLTHFPILDFSPIFNQIRSIIPTRINSTSNFNTRFSFQNTHIKHIENRSLVYGSYILSLFSESEDPLMHRKHIRLNTKITHHLNLTLCCFSLKEAPILSRIWTMFLSFLFHEDTDSVITHESNRVLLCTRWINDKSFSEENKYSK